MPSHPVSERQAVVSPSSHSTNLGHCQGYLQPKEGSAVSYHKKQSCQCRCLICTLLCRSVLTRDVQPSLHQRTNVNFHPQVKLHTSPKSMGKCGPEANTLALDAALCYSSANITYYLHHTVQAISRSALKLMLKHYRTRVTWGI